MVKVFFKSGVSQLLFLTPVLLCEDPGSTVTLWRFCCASCKISTGATTNYWGTEKWYWNFKNPGCGSHQTV